MRIYMLQLKKRTWWHQRSSAVVVANGPKQARELLFDALSNSAWLDTTMSTCLGIGRYTGRNIKPYIACMGRKRGH